MALDPGLTVAGSVGILLLIATSAITRFTGGSADFETYLTSEDIETIVVDATSTRIRRVRLERTDRLESVDASP